MTLNIFANRGGQEVPASQLDANFAQLNGLITANLATLTNHIGNTSNPHEVTSEQVGLGNVANLAPLDLPISTATQTALDLKASIAALSAHIGDTANPHSVTKTQVGLGNVDNTSDANKPVSTAVATALALKIDAALKGAANGFAPLDSASRLPFLNLAPLFFSTRAAFAATTFASTPPDGVVVYAGGYSYVRSAGATLLPGLNDWLPFGRHSPAHYGGDRYGVSDSKDAVERCVNSGYPVDWGVESDVWLCSANVVWNQSTGNFDCDWISSGATIKLDSSATIIRSFCKLTATDQSFQLAGKLRFDAQRRAFRCFEVSQTPTAYTSIWNSGWIEAHNAYRSSTITTGGDGIYIACGYASFSADVMWAEDCLIARGAGVPGSQGISGFTLNAISSTFCPQNIRLGFVRSKNVRAEDRWYTPDQDGCRIFPSGDSATDPLPWSSRPVIEAGWFTNCCGRAVKSQCEMGSVSNLLVERDTGPLDRVTMTLTAAPGGNTSGTLSSAWFGSTTTTATILWSDGSYSGDATFTAGSTSVSWTGAAPAGVTTTILIGGLGLTLTAALSNARSGTLTRAFGGVTSSKYTATFSDGSVRYGITLTNGSTALSWTAANGDPVTASATLTEVGIPVVGGFEVDFQVGGGMLSTCEFKYRNFVPLGLFTSNGTSETGSINRLSSGSSTRALKCFIYGPSTPLMTQPFRFRKQKVENYMAVVDDVEFITDNGVALVESVFILTGSASGDMYLRASNVIGLVTKSLVDISASGSSVGTTINFNLDVMGCVNPLYTTATLTAAPSSATSATLTAAWSGASGVYTISFSDGTARAATFTKTSTGITWTGPVTVSTTSIIVQGPLLVPTLPLVTNTPPATSVGTALLGRCRTANNIGFTDSNEVIVTPDGTNITKTFGTVSSPSLFSELYDTTNNRKEVTVNGGTIRHDSGSHRPLVSDTMYSGTATGYWKGLIAGTLYILDGATNVSSFGGMCAIYVDSADGDLKIKFSDGTVKTIVTD